MKKKYWFGWLLAGAAVMFLITHSVVSAADRVVVIPLDGGSGDTGGVSTVTSAGQVWMDRNLGALRVATQRDDPDAYGSLYQWGRFGDGHEYRESPVTSTNSSGDVPGHGDFITTSTSPFDWRSPQNDNLWQGVSGTNNPCPAGFRLPTETEWETEMTPWSSNNYVGAFASPLKLVVSGSRSRSDGTLTGVGNSGCYWSNTANDSGAIRLYFHNALAIMQSSVRSTGCSIRCIKD